MISWNDLESQVKSNDPAAMRWFGALLERTSYTPARRTDAQNAVHAATVAAMPKFAIVGWENADTKKACLWEPVVAKLGKHWTPMFQESGSCVCQGGQNATAYTMAIEAWEKGEAEEVKYPVFAYVAYGRSRHYIGERSPGEGSLGSAMAKAVKEDGIVDPSFSGLPPWHESNGGLTIGKAKEIEWSYIPDARDKFDPFQEAAKLHPIRTAAQCKSANEVAAALRNGYGCTCASMWGGQMQCQTVSDPPVLMNKRVTEWAHQMSIIGWWEHPKLGEIFYILNSWGNPHGNDPSGGPPGGFWVTKADVDWICRDEVFAFSSFEGFPARNLPWSSILPFTN